MRDRMESTAGFESARYRTPDGIDLAYGLLPAARRGMTFTISRDRNKTEVALHFDEPTAGTVPTRGSVIYLHGFGLDASSMLPWALALSELGYRGITVDLRNHGRSSRGPAGFGTREARDVAALVAHLQADGRLAPPVYLFGVSYGAATALFAEPLLRERIAGIVVMETYANAGDGVRSVITRLQTARGDDGMRARLWRAVARWRYDAPAVERGVREAGERLGLDLDAIDVRAALATTATCTLLLHGAGDHYIPVAAGRSLADASTWAHYRELADETHFGLPLRIDWLAHPIDAWMQAAAGGDCGPLRLPADPLAGGGPSRFTVDDDAGQTTQAHAGPVVHPATEPATDAAHAREHAVPH